jgi:hypothetical protein
LDDEEYAEDEPVWNNDTDESQQDEAQGYPRPHSPAGWRLLHPLAVVSKVV